MRKLMGKRWSESLICGGLAAAAMMSPFERAGGQQTQAPPAWPPELVTNMEKVRDAALASDYAWRQVAHLTENIGPRLSGSPQVEQAVNYVAGEMRLLGLEVKLEKLTVPHWVRGEEHGELTIFPGQARGTTQKIVVTALGNSAATPSEGLTAEVLVVSNFDELAALGSEKVAGRIVLFNKQFDKRMAAQGKADAAYEGAVVYRVRGGPAAKALGAVAALVRSAGGADYRLPHTGATMAAGIPAAAVTAEDADLLADLTRQGRVVMHLVLTPQTMPDAVSYNVIADLKGSEHPEQVVIVSGHLDSWDLGTGAIDDGVGVAMAMQTANLFQQLGLRPKRTLRVIAWMDEENGQHGAKTYAEEHKSELANHVGAIESDGGGDHPVGFSGSLKPATVDLFKPVTKVLEAIGADLLEDGADAGTDIEPMGNAGVPVFGIIQDGRTYYNYHHTAADTLDKVRPSELAENAAAMAVLAYALANMPQPLSH